MGAMIFENNAAFDNINFDTLNTEVLGNLDIGAQETFTQSMDAFTQLVGSMQNIFNAELTIYNFVAIFTDAIDAISKLNDVYPILGPNMAVFYDVMFYASLISEKAIFFFESFEEYQYMYEDAILLTELEFERRIQSLLDNSCDANFDVLNLGVEVSKFAGSVIIDNWAEPVEKTADVWNNFIGNVPFLDDYPINQKCLTDLENFVQNTVDSVQGSLIEAKVLFFPFKAQIANVFQSAMGC